MAERGERGEERFESIYYQEFRLKGSLVYDGKDLIPQSYSVDGYPGKPSISYEYITYDEPFSTRTVVFYIPRKYLVDNVAQRQAANSEEEEM